MVDLFCKAEFIRFDTGSNWAEPFLIAQVQLAFTEKMPFGPINSNLNLPAQSPLPHVKWVNLSYLEATLTWKPTEGSEVALAVGRMIPGWGSPLEFKVGVEFSNATMIGFPLSRSLVGRVEDLRNGRDATFGITLLFTGVARGDHASEGDATQAFGVNNLPVALPRGAGDRLSVAKSEWTERILKGLQYGEWACVEFPVTPLPGLPKVDEQIATATRHYRMGEWRSCVESSRLAIQECRTHLETVISPAFNDRPWMNSGKTGTEKLGDSLEAFRELEERMVDFQSKLSGLLSPAAHPRGDDTAWERPDAEFALELALACRRYVGLRFLKVPPGVPGPSPKP